MSDQKYKTYDELPLMLSNSFPAFHVGKRLICPRERLLQWLDDSVAAKLSDD